MKNEIEKLIKNITEKPKELEIQTTRLVEKITHQVEALTSAISTLKETIEKTRVMLLSDGPDVRAHLTCWSRCLICMCSELFRALIV